MSALGVTVSGMDIGVIVYTAELGAPELRETARRILETEAARFGVSLEPASTASSLFPVLGNPAARMNCPPGHRS
jgi:hypothetical protein